MLSQELLKEIEKIPVIDTHTHLFRGKLAVKSPGVFLLYHMVLYELCAAGAPTHLFPSRRRFRGNIEDFVSHFLPFFQRISNTGFAWCLERIVKDLYEFDEPITPESYPRLYRAVEKKTSRPKWPLEILRRGNIVRSMTSNYKVPPLKSGEPDAGLRFGMENHPLSCLGNKPDPLQESFLELEKMVGEKITSAKALDRAFDHWFTRKKLSNFRAYISWHNARMDFNIPSAGAVKKIFSRVRAGKALSDQDQKVLNGLVFRSTVAGIRGKAKVFQYVFGCEELESDQKVRLPLADGYSGLARDIGKIILDCPDLHFDLLNGYEPLEPALCSLAARMPNVSLTSFWWHNFYPTVMHRCWQRRIDMVPWTGLCGFFSDAYCLEWQYARLKMTRQVLANLLAERVTMGFFTADRAIELARQILFETPKKIFLPDEKIEVSD